MKRILSVVISKRDLQENNLLDIIDKYILNLFFVLAIVHGTPRNIKLRFSYHYYNAWQTVIRVMI